MGRKRARLLERERPAQPHLDRVPREANGCADRAEPVAREVLSLQTSAGNEAVVALLVQRDEAVQAESAERKERVTGVLTLDAVGPIQLVQFRLGGSELSFIAEVSPATEGLVDLARSRAKIERGTIDPSDGSAFLMTDLSITSLSFEGGGTGTHGASEEPGLVRAALSCKSVTRRERPREKAPNDEWK